MEDDVNTENDSYNLLVGFLACLTVDSQNVLIH